MGNDLKMEPQRLALAEHRFSTYSAIAEGSVNKEDVLRPDYWAHVARQLRIHDKVVLTTDDGSIYAELLVIACDRLWAKMYVLRWDNLQTRDVSETQAAQSDPGDAFDIKYKGTFKKHVVIRKSDGAIIHEGEQTKAGAMAWLAEHIRVTA